MTFAKTAAAALIATMFPLAAFAGHNTGNTAARLDQRDAYLQQRIDAGIRDGSLTRREAAELQHNQARIERMEARAAADGHISRAERARIIQMQNRQSAAIERERNDNQRAHQAYQQGRHDQHHNAGHIGQRHDGSQHFNRTNHHSVRAGQHSSAQPVPATAAAAAPVSTASTQRGNNGNHYGQIRNGNNGNSGNSATQSGPSTNSSVVAQNNGSRHHNQR